MTIFCCKWTGNPSTFVEREPNEKLPLEQSA
jgi:hypothetical protein